MADLTTTPIIIWQTASMSCADLQFSPAISFMGLKWRLKLALVKELQYGDRFRLTLEKLSLPGKSQDDIIFDVQTEVEAKNKKGLAFKTTSSLHYNEWYLWGEKIHAIYTNFDVTFDEGIVFWVVIKARSGVSVLSRLDVEEDFSECLQNLSKDFGSKLYDNKDQSDVVLKCGDRSISAHKAILSARSEYFAAMFRNKMKESEENVVEVKNTEPAVLEELVYYLYTGEISDFRTDSLRKLYKIADMYVVEALKIKCAFLVMDSYRLDADHTAKLSFESIASLPERTPFGNQCEDAAGGSEFEGDSSKSSDFGNGNAEDSKLSEFDAEDSKIGEYDAEDIQLEDTSAKNRKLLKYLLRSREWETLCLESPKLAHDMCKFFLFNKDS